MYPFERFTALAKKALSLAQEEAERSRHSYIGTEHLLLGIMRLPTENIAGRALSNLGVDVPQVRKVIDSVLGRNERIIIQQIIPTSRVKKVIEISFEEAHRMGDNFVGPEHLLLGLMIEGEGIAANVLKDLGVTLESLRPEIERMLRASADAPGEVPHHSFKVGERVLVHDTEPPHRLWEGRLTSVGVDRCEVRVIGRPFGELVNLELKFIHRVPMREALDCVYCWL